ncbi:MAG TPA: DUF3261 domain-containing protein [Gammaproteobacteria bacterium]|nr:DUF3261 domain-containing protein [Gammaproteobacteria bacterium]
MKLRYVFVLLIPLIAGCATMPQLPGCVKIGPFGQACPLPPAALPAVEATHIVAVTHDGDRQTFMGRLRVDAESLRLAGFSLFGTHLFTISYDGHDIVSRPERAELHADLIVVMLEAALAEPTELRPRLHGITLKLSGTGDTEVRELYEHGRLVARIETTGKPLKAARIVMTIPPAKLTLRMTPLGADQ